MLTHNAALHQSLIVLLTDSITIILVQIFFFLKQDLKLRVESVSSSPRSNLHCNAVTKFSQVEEWFHFTKKFSIGRNMLRHRKHTSSPSDTPSNAHTHTHTHTHTITHSPFAIAPPYVLFPLHISICPSITHPLIEVPGVAIGANKELFGLGTNPINIQRQSLCLPASYYVIWPGFFNPSLNWHCKLQPLIIMFEWWMCCILWIINNNKLCRGFIKLCWVTKCCRFHSIKVQLIRITYHNIW